MDNKDKKMILSGQEIRRKFLDFQKGRGHNIEPSASIIPENDSSTLFISSGMQPLVPYFLGQKHPAGTRLANSQKCFRAEDIEEVGDGRHNTFFEMLGNWSFGDYFKEYQLSGYFNFLVNELKLDPNRLYVTVFKGDAANNLDADHESVGIWKNLFKGEGIDALDVDSPEINGMRGGKIFYYGSKKNWWSRSGVPERMPDGEIGGPDSEVFYDLGVDLEMHEKSIWKDEHCHVNCDCGRFVEIGNSVFMEFRKISGKFVKLEQKNIDFGGGLERTVMAMQGKTNVFETDLFSELLKKISSLSNGKSYNDNRREFEIIADHIKASVFIMGDRNGISPSNVDQGYLIRRLLRRAIRYGKKLGISSLDWMSELADVVINDYCLEYSELKRNRDFIIDNIKTEEKKFQRTVENGLKKILNFLDSKDKNSIKQELENGGFSFDVFQTYGFPVEMLLEEVKNRGISLDEAKVVNNFSAKMFEHQALSRTASAGKFKGGLADSSEKTTRLHTAAHLLLAALRLVLGPHVYQKGSNITSERLRFDFSHGEKISDEQILVIEEEVNKRIKDDLKVVCEEVDLNEAKERGAMGVFESKYGEKVKVYKIFGDNEVFSYEICGGPHVNSLSELGTFKIEKESSSGAGVRRIKAVLL